MNNFKNGDLVYHKDLQGMLGIGVIIQARRRSALVKFGLDTSPFPNSDLDLIDTSHTKTIPLWELKKQTALGKPAYPKIIIGNQLHEYVGIGYIAIKIINEDDLHMYPRVID